MDQIKWWDFPLPESIEGSALLVLDFEPDSAPAAHRHAYEQLRSAIVQATETAQRGGQVNAKLEQILRRQGDSVLPPRFRQSMKFEVRIYGRVADDDLNTEQLDSGVAFVLPFAEGDISLSKQDPASKITIKIEGRFFGEDPGFVVTAKDAQGRSASTRLAVDVERLRLVDVEGKKMAPWVPLRGGDELELPGSGSYESFDLYLDESMSPFHLIGE